MEHIVIFGSASQSLVKVRRPLIQALRRRGHRVLACAPNISADRRQLLYSWGIETACIPMNRHGINPVADLRTIRALYDLFRKWSPDKVLSYNAKPMVYGSLAAWAVGSDPYVLITGLGRNYTKTTPRTRFIRGVLDWMYQITFLLCKKVYFQNKEDPSLLKSRGVLSENTSFTITNGSGVDTEYFVPEPLPDDPAFLCLARLIPEKGIREYVAAAKIVKQRFPEVSFLLAGHLEPDVPEAITKEELQGWVAEEIINYKGYVEDVRPLIAQASTYVLPTYYREGTPRSILEAMSMGRPIITTTAPGCMRTVEDGENGWVIPTKNPEKLADAMFWMINHQNRLEEMGNKSRKRASKMYDVEEINKNIMRGMNII